MSAETPARPRPSRHRSRARARRLLLLLAVPALLWFVVFMIGPLVSLFYYSLTKWQGLLGEPVFSGLENFARMVSDPDVHVATRNSLLQLVITIPIMIAIAFMVAYYLNLQRRGHRLVRAVLFTPLLLSAPVLAMVMLGVFSPNGMANSILATFGVGPVSWLTTARFALPVLWAVGIWSGTAVSSIMLAARLADIPGEVYEAAELDGCGHWRRMWRIAFPIAFEYVGVIVMLQYLWVLFSSAALVLLLTRGGPGNSTMTLSFLVYDLSFNRSQVGYGQAIAVVLFIVGVVGMLAIRRAFRARY